MSATFKVTSSAPDASLGMVPTETVQYPLPTNMHILVNNIMLPDNQISPCSKKTRG